MIETQIIKFGDQDWKVTTPLHFVVGAIKLSQWVDIAWAWQKTGSIGGTASFLAAGMFDYVCDHDKLMRDYRNRFREPHLAFVNDPLLVNEMQPEEVTLACIENDKLILTNFADLPGIENAMKIYKLGEFWLSYATGGAELPLRTGKERR